MKLLFTGLLLTISSLSLAQYQNRIATLTDRKESSMIGVVRYYDWSKNPDSIEFGKDSLGTLRKVPIRDVRTLSINDGPVYEGLYLKVPYYVKGPVTFGSNIVAMVDSTYYLAELLLMSESVKLYRIFDNNEKVRFCIAKYDSLVLLEDIDVQFVRRDKVFSIREQNYRKQLSATLHECPTLNTTDVQYNEKSLISLVKSYLSFCRIDSKVYFEQQKISKAIVGLGAYGAFGSSATGNGALYGLYFQVLLPRQLHKTFVILSVGGSINAKVDTKLDLGIYGGRYFGRGQIQGRVYTGLSIFAGPLDTGLGISYRKMVALDLRYPVFIGLLSGLKEDGVHYIRPLVNLSAVFPISRFDKTK